MYLSIINGELCLVECLDFSRKAVADNDQRPVINYKIYN